MTTKDWKPTVSNEQPHANLKAPQHSYPSSNYLITYQNADLSSKHLNGKPSGYHEKHTHQPTITHTPAPTASTDTNPYQKSYHTSLQTCRYTAKHAAHDEPTTITPIQ